MKTEVQERLNQTQLVNASKAYNRLKNITAQELTEITFECVVDGANGIYSPQLFAERFPHSNIAKEYWGTLNNGPEDSYYWETWETVSNDWKLDNYRIHLGESGDIFVYDESVIEMWESATKTDSYWDEING